MEEAIKDGEQSRARAEESADGDRQDSIQARN